MKTSISAEPPHRASRHRTPRSPAAQLVITDVQSFNFGNHLRVTARLLRGGAPAAATHAFCMMGSDFAGHFGVEEYSIGEDRNASFVMLETDGIAEERLLGATCWLVDHK